MNYLQQLYCLQSIKAHIFYNEILVSLKEEQLKQYQHFILYNNLVH